jgi:DNA-binding NarL/FixJ family response regulator
MLNSRTTTRKKPVGVRKTPGSPPIILLADDHKLLAEGLQGLLSPEFKVAEIVEDGRMLLAANLRLKPDVVITDISMPNLNGIEAIRELKRNTPDVRVIVLTMHSDVDYVTEAFEAGANGYVLKSAAVSELADTIRAVMKGQRYLSSSLESKLAVPLRTGGGKPWKGLSTREREVLQLLAEGKIAKEIGTILGVSKKTAEFHKYRLMEKLGLRTVAELARYAAKRGIVSSGS